MFVLIVDYQKDRKEEEKKERERMRNSKEKLENEVKVGNEVGYRRIKGQLRSRVYRFSLFIVVFF